MESSSQHVIPRRDEEFHRLQDKFKSKSQNFKTIPNSNKAISSRSGDSLQAPNSNLAKHEIADPTDSGISPNADGEERKMPSVKELAMKFKASQPIQPKPAVKKVSTTKFPNHQATIGEVQPRAVKPASSNVKQDQPSPTANKANDYDHLHQHPIHIKRMSKWSEQVTIGKVQPQNDPVKLASPNVKLASPNVKLASPNVKQDQPSPTANKADDYDVLQHPIRTKRISNRSEQVTIGKVQPHDDVVKLASPNVEQDQPSPTANKADDYDVLQHPIHTKRISNRSEQSFTEQIIPLPEELPKEIVSMKTLSTEKSSFDEFDAHEPTPVRRTTPPEKVQPNDSLESKTDQLDGQQTLPVQSTVENDSQDDDLQELSPQVETEITPKKPQPPMTLEIPTPYQTTLEDEEVFSPPLPKTPPPHKVPFFPPMPKTPPPNKTPFFADIIDPSLSVITLPSAGANTEEILLSIIPGEINNNKTSNDSDSNIVEQFLMSPNAQQTKWDAFAEINNNNKKSIERKISVAAATEVYEKKSPADVQKTFFQEESEHSSVFPNESQASGTTTGEVHSENNGELLQITETVISGDTTDSSFVNGNHLESVPDEVRTEDADEITTTDSDGIKEDKVYYRQTSEINSLSLQTKEVSSRPKSLPPPNTEPERRKTAIELLATPPTFRPKEEKELIRLRNQIVRASRTTKTEAPN